MTRRISSTWGLARSKRGVEVLTGNLLMLMVLAAVFSSIAFIVKSSSDRYTQIQERQLVDGIASYLKTKVSETWGVGADEIPLQLPERLSGSGYIVQMDPSGSYFSVRTSKGTYRIKSSGIVINGRSIRSTEPHSIGLRGGKIMIDPPPLTEILYPLDGSVFSGPFNVSYRTSKSAKGHSIYLDGLLVGSSSTTLDEFTVDPGVTPTNLSDGQHTMIAVTQNSYGEGTDLVRFVIDRTPPSVALDLSQVLTNDLKVTCTEIKSYGSRAQLYVFVTDENLRPVRGLDASNFYAYNSPAEVAQGGRFALSVSATDLESKVDPWSYVITRQYKGDEDQTASRESSWDSKEYNETVAFWASASDVAGNTATTPNQTKNPVNRLIDVGAPDRKSDLSIIFTNDVSGSMNWVMWKDEDPKAGEESRLDFMKGGVESFLQKMFPEDEAAICSFATNYATGLEEIILQADFMPTDADGILQLCGAVDTLTTRDGTPLYDALYNSTLWIKDRTKFKVILVLTDGKDLNYATGEPYSNRTSDEVIDLARMYSVPIYCVGLGEEDKVDIGVLNAIAEQTEGRFYLAPTPERLQEAYDQIAGELLSGYKLTYHYGSPIMGGENITLLVYDSKGRNGRLDLTLPAPEVEVNLAPIVSVTAPNGGEVVSGTIQIRWSASDPNDDNMTFDIYYSKNAGGNWTLIQAGLTGMGPTYSLPWDTSKVPSGKNYLVKVVASDGDLQTSDGSDSVFEVKNSDTTPPTVTITYPGYPPVKKVKNTITMAGTASDTGGSGLDRVEIWMNGVLKGLATIAAGNWQFVFDTKTMPNQVVTVVAKAYDGAGNSAPPYTILMEIFN